MIIVFLLMLIDVHTLMMLLFKNQIPLVYGFSGGSLSILKGIVFFIPSRDIFSFLDIIVGILVIINLLVDLISPIKIALYIYLIYKIIASLAAF